MNPKTLLDYVSPYEAKVWKWVTNLSVIAFTLGGGLFGATSELAATDRVLYWLMSAAGVLLGYAVWIPLITVAIHLRKRQLKPWPAYRPTGQSFTDPNGTEWTIYGREDDR